MRASTLIRLAVRSIRRNTMRTLLTMLGIIIGVAAVLVMVAIGKGAEAQIRSTIQNLGTNMIVITPGASAQGGVSRGAGSFNRLTIEDAERLARESLLLDAVSPVIFAPTMAVGGSGNWRTVCYGVDADYREIRDWDVSSGRYFDANDVRTMKKVCLIGKTVADNLYPDQDPVGQKIRLRHVPVEIIGVLAEKGQNAQGNDQDDVILAPYTTVRNRLSGHQFIAQILASTASPDDIPAAEREITAIMRESHKLADYEADDFEVRNQTDLAETASATTKVMTMLLAAIAGISLLVGGIGIMNIMLVSVTERTREIGIRMAVGARGGDVLTQFLVESIVLCLGGGALGVAVGVTGAWLLGRMAGWATQVTPDTMLLALGFAAAVGLFFGWYPARKAAALNPIDALRYE